MSMKIIPFAFGKEEAKKRFLSFVKTKQFAPNEFCSDENAESIRALYVPFCLISAEVRGDFSALAKKIKHWKADGKKYTEISDYRVVRQGDIRFSDIFVCTCAEREELQGILPYNIEERQEFDSKLLESFSMEEATPDKENKLNGIERRIENHAAALLRQSAVGYSSFEREKIHIDIASRLDEDVLVPVWRLDYEAFGQVYTFSINGQTGKICGKVPICKKKLAAFFGIVSGAVTAIAAVLGVLLCV